MQKLFSLLMGLGLIVVGVLFLAGNLVMPLLGFNLVWFEVWRLWPLFIIAVGIGLAALAMGFVRKPAMGAIFIPALPVLTTGAINLYVSLTDRWQVWATAWPLIVLAVAVGLLLAALTTRIVWLGIPAILVGLNALVLAFCAWTGLWSAWSVLWAVEPLGVGLVLLLVALKVRSWLVAAFGLLFCEVAWMAVFATLGVPFLGAWVYRLIGPGLFILAGIVLLGWAFLGRRSAPRLEQ